MTRWQRYDRRLRRDAIIGRIIAANGGSKLGPLYLRWLWCDPFRSPVLPGRGFHFELLWGVWEFRFGWREIALLRHGYPLFRWRRHR